MAKKKYDWKITVRKGFKFALYYGIPYLIGALLIDNPEIASITIGTLATMVNNYIKNGRK